MSGVKTDERFSEEAGGRQPAPGDLRIVQEFLNTRDIEAGTDLLDGLQRANEWLVGQGLVTEPKAVATVEELASVTDLREALRNVLISRHDSAEVEEATRSVVSEVAAAGQISMMVDPSGTLRTVAQASGLAGALARIILTVHRAQADGQWPRLKVCSNDSCRWAFWDSSRNRSGRWCTMSLCGNQAKVAAYRDRQ
jgi:predicted RNA-binding Zn ribbon-like protein